LKKSLRFISYLPPSAAGAAAGAVRSWQSAQPALAWAPVDGSWHFQQVRWIATLALRLSEATVAIREPWQPAQLRAVSGVAWP
jgi:hypothetical protein